VRHRGVDDRQQLLFNGCALVKDVLADIDELDDIVSLHIRLEVLPFDLNESRVFTALVLLLLVSLLSGASGKIDDEAVHL